jgi:hypothetical protein
MARSRQSCSEDLRHHQRGIRGWGKDRSISRMLDSRIPGVDLVRLPRCSVKNDCLLLANTTGNTRSRPVDFNLGVKYVQNSLRIDSPEFAVIQAAAAEHQIAVSLGFSERDGESVYIAQAMISASGQTDSHGANDLRRRNWRPMPSSHRRRPRGR